MIPDRHTRAIRVVFILPSDSVRLNDVLGDKPGSSSKGGARTPSPCCGRRLRRKRQRKENGCWTLLRNLRMRPAFCVAKWIPSPMRSFFLFWAVQLEVVSALLWKNPDLKAVVKERRHLYGACTQAANHTIHMVPPKPFRASMGLSVTPLSTAPIVQYQRAGFPGILELEFSKHCQDGIRYGLEQGLFGWNVTGYACFECTGFITVRSAHRRTSAHWLIVLEQALKESGTQLLEPYHLFILYAPQECLSGLIASPKYCATIETAG